jgi:hypothetical protein
MHTHTQVYRLITLQIAEVAGQVLQQQVLLAGQQLALRLQTHLREYQAQTQTFLRITHWRTL